MTLKRCWLPGKLKTCKVRTFFFLNTIDEIPAIFSNLEPGARPKLEELVHEDRVALVCPSSISCVSLVLSKLLAGIYNTIYTRLKA